MTSSKRYIRSVRSSSSRASITGDTPFTLRYIVATVGLLTAALLPYPAVAQICAAELCACQPPIIEVTLDYSMSCEDANIEVGPGTGVEKFECTTEADPGTDITEFVPVTRVIRFDIVEYGQNDQAVTQDGRFGFNDFPSGTKIAYSGLQSFGAPITRESLPKRILWTFRALNGQSKAFNFAWSITFSNDCGVFPVLSEGQIPGLGSITSVTRPEADLCPLAESAIPTDVPSLAPSDMPSKVPSNAPSMVPSSTPSSGKGRSKGSPSSSGKGGSGKGSREGGEGSSSSAGKGGSGKGGGRISVSAGKERSGKGGSGEGGVGVSGKGGSGKGGADEGRKLNRISAF